MKKFFLFAALFAAISLNAKEIVVDLSTTPTNVSGSNPATCVFANDTLRVNYVVNAGYAVSGAEIAIDNLTNVTGISFDIKGDGSGRGFLHYLRDTEGNRWYDSGSWYGLGADWVSKTSVPNASLWDGQAAEDFGKYPFKTIGFVANPSAAGEGFFTLRNVIITVADDPTAIDNANANAKASKIIRDGQVLIIRDGRTFNALGAEIK